MANPNPDTSGLRPIKPGEVRNPNGSSRKQRLTTALIRAIETKGLDDPFVQVGLREALKGDFKFWSYIFDRIDGKMVERREVEQTAEATQTLRDFLADPPPATTKPKRRPAKKARKGR